MEQSIDKYLSFNKTFISEVLSDIEKYFSILTKHCFVDLHYGINDRCNAKPKIIGDMGEFIIEKLQILSKYLDGPNDVKESIDRFKETCNLCKKCPNGNYKYADSLLKTLKNEAENISILLKKSIEKFIKKKEKYEKEKETEKRIKELELKNLNLEEKIKDLQKDSQELLYKNLNLENKFKTSNQNNKNSLFSSTMNADNKLTKSEINDADIKTGKWGYK